MPAVPQPVTSGWRRWWDVTFLRQHLQQLSPQVRQQALATHPQPESTLAITCLDLGLYFSIWPTLDCDSFPINIYTCTYVHIYEWMSVTMYRYVCMNEICMFQIYLCMCVCVCAYPHMYMSLFVCYILADWWKTWNTVSQKQQAPPLQALHLTNGHTGLEIQ